jgi:hypothetical protein
LLFIAGSPLWLQIRLSPQLPHVKPPVKFNF